MYIKIYFQISKIFTKIFVSLVRTFRNSDAARALFTGVRGDNIHSNVFKAHSERILSSLDLCIALLDDEPTLNAALSHLANQHTTRGVLPAYWTVSKVYISINYYDKLKFIS